MDHRPVFGPQYSILKFGIPKGPSICELLLHSNSCSASSRNSSGTECPEPKTTDPYPIASQPGVVGEGSLEPAVVDADALPGAKWIPNVRLNYAENLLRHPAEATAVIALDESCGRSTYSFAQLRLDVARHQQALTRSGVEAGDVIAAMLPNRCDAVAAMLGVASIGATWCSVSPDFGVAGALDRFGQVQPRILYTCRRYRCGGKEFDITAKLGDVIKGLPSLTRTVLVDGDPGPLDGQFHIIQPSVVGKSIRSPA